MENLIGYLRKRIKDCVKEANKENPKIKEKIIQSIRERMSSNAVGNKKSFFGYIHSYLLFFHIFVG